MLTKVLKVVAHSEVQAVKRRVTAAGFALAAAFLVGLALVFALLSLFLWLMTQLEPWVAALILFGGLIVGALLLWLIGKLIAQRAGARARKAPELQALLDEMSGFSKMDGVAVTAASTALAIGFAIGRRLTK